MSRVFTSIVDLQNAMQQSIDIALKNVASAVKYKLKDYILEDFYTLYSPHVYQRTYQFLSSADAISINPTTYKVFINMDNMHYKEAYPEEVVSLASEGYHGNTSIFREGYFWEDFIDWCEVNIPILMKSELRKQGLNVR